MREAAWGGLVSALGSPSFSWLRRAGLYGALAALGAAVVSQFLPPTYRAETKILPITSSGPSLPYADLAGTAELSGVAGLLQGTTDNPALTYPEILLSRMVLDRTLLRPYPPDSPDTTRTVLAAMRVKGRTPREHRYLGLLKLRKAVIVRANPRSGLVTVDVDSRDSTLSAFVANSLIEELDRFNVEARTSRGRAMRQFVEGRLRDAGAELAHAERALVRFREANLRIGNSPLLLLEQARLQRQVDIQADVFRLLSRQFELSRIEEHRDVPSFTILESAQPPLRKYRPRTMVNVFSAGILAAGAVFLLSRDWGWGSPARSSPE